LPRANDADSLLPAHDADSLSRVHDEDDAPSTHCSPRHQGRPATTPRTGWRAL